jgi:hypothetical protein
VNILYRKLPENNNICLQMLRLQLLQTTLNENAQLHKKYHALIHLNQHGIITYPLTQQIKKKSINAKANNKAASHFSAPFNKLNVQLTIFTVAGKEIITVIVLYNALLR